MSKSYKGGSAQPSTLSPQDQDIESWLEAGLGSLDAERAVLGALLYDNQRLPALQDEITPECFLGPIHREIYACARDYILAGRQADPVSLRLWAKSKNIEPAYLLTLLEESALTQEQALEYARIVRDLHERREIIRLCKEAQEIALAPPGAAGADDILQETIRALTSFQDARIVAPAGKTFADAAFAFIENLDAPRAQAMATGFKALDQRLGGGLQRGELVIVAGRPSMGKTALANNIAMNLARAGHKGLIFSHEMSADAMMMRALSARSYKEQYGVDRFAYTSLRNGAPHIPRDQLRGYAEEMRHINLRIDDRAGLSVEQIERAARASKKTMGGLDFISIDYLQIMGRPQRDGRNDAAIIGEMTAKLKTLARNMDMPVIALSQLSRQVESRDDKRPTLSDLRESGAIEQDADVVLGVYREAYYVSRQEPSASAPDEKVLEWAALMDKVRDAIEIITLKQRQGPVGVDVLKAFIEYDTIKDAPPTEQRRMPMGGAPE